jgi:hypothetical protein
VSGRGAECRGCVPWRPVLKQLPPPRSKKLAAEIDPEPTFPIVRTVGRAIYQNRGFVVAGGLMAYGTNGVALYTRAASFVDRILRGAKVSELPIEYPTTFELVINLKTAKALGLTMLESILLRADEVIE